MDGPSEQSMGRRREVRFPVLLITPFMLAGGLSHSEIRGSQTRNIIRRIWDRECSTRAGRYAASAVEHTAGTGVVDPEFHSADRGPGMFHSRGAEIWGLRTRNFIRQIADPECSTRTGPYAASAVERTAVNMAASPLNARHDDAGMGRARVLAQHARPLDLSK
ncbi:hypothetical protein B0H13DRAFT_1850470 [Mycena leptocephala]|nr:hypothetical protein B0H13DRAFT_1850470 [Mycena leptocephala]